MPPLLKSLEQRFSTTRYLRSSKSTDLIRAGGSSREWLAARSLCLYSLIECGHVPAGKRHGFVEIAVKRLAPFADPECHVVWTATAAMVWIWPRASMLPDEDGVPLRNDLDAVNPESVYLGQPEPAGELLLGTSDGFEGRIWRDQLLVASRWWPAIPSLADWSDFCRGAGGGVPEQVPDAQPFALHDRPWADHRRRTASAWLQRLQRPAAMAAVFVLAALLAWQAGSLIRLAIARANVASQAQTLNANLSDILQAREHANRDADLANALLGLRPPMAQIALMARVAQLLQGSGGQVVDWSVPERGKLAITLRLAKPDPEALVKNLEASGLLTEVTSDNGAGPNEIVLRARVLPAKAAGDKS